MDSDEESAPTKQTPAKSATKKASAIVAGSGKKATAGIDTKKGSLASKVRVGCVCEWESTFAEGTGNAETKGSGDGVGR